MDTTVLQRKRVAKKHWERDLMTEMWTAGFIYSWRKMQA